MGQLIEIVTDFFQHTLHKEASVIGIAKNEIGWWAEVESVEDSEYQRKRALDDVVATYEVQISDCGEIEGYQRKGLRERSKVDD